jgi:2-oxoglutarate ferredoxin oxidoreductase subunit beta
MATAVLDVVQEIRDVPVEAYEGPVHPDWCPGCGDYGVLKALQKALAYLQIDPSQVVVVSGIGCSSNLPGFIRAYGFHGLHGRALPVAEGIKLANPRLHVIVTGGDGDGYGIGMGHFIHAMRRNLDITYIVMNNQIYGLTTGQVSPTSMKGVRTKSTPYGNIEPPVNPIALALMSGATYVARGFSGDPNHLASLVAHGIRHRGFALIDVFSPCVTFNNVNTYAWFRQRVYRLEDEGHDPSDFARAVEKSLEFGDRIPIGLFYQFEAETYEDLEPAYKRGVPVDQPLGLSPEEGARLIQAWM